MGIDNNVVAFSYRRVFVSCRVFHQKEHFVNYVILC